MLTPTTVILVLVAGGLGALARMATLRAATRRGLHSSLGLLLLNLAGSFVAGFVASLLGGRGADPRLSVLLIAGLLGGYTTFSAVSLEVAAASAGARRRVTVEAILSVLAAPPLALAGLAVGALAAGAGA